MVENTINKKSQGEKRMCPHVKSMKPCQTFYVYLSLNIILQLKHSQIITTYTNQSCWYPCLRKCQRKPKYLEETHRPNID